MTYLENPIYNTRALRRVGFVQTRTQSRKWRGRNRTVASFLRFTLSLFKPRVLYGLTSHSASKGQHVEFSEALSKRVDLWQLKRSSKLMVDSVLLQLKCFTNRLQFQTGFFFNVQKSQEPTVYEIAKEVCLEVFNFQPETWMTWVCMYCFGLW